jgi:hypothetical protein
LRGLQSADPARRAQAAQHLAAVPSGSAAPALAQAIGTETDAHAKAALVRALVVCGGEGSAQIASGLLVPAESALVRLAAVEALAPLGGDRARAALEAGARDPAPAVRRRTVALLLGSGEHGDLLASLSTDRDASVRAACRAAAGDAAPPMVHEPQAVRSAPAAVPQAALLVPHAAPVVPRDLAAEAQSACRAAIFGLTEAELASALSLETSAAGELVERLVTAGRLGRRGKRVVARGEALASGEERR